MTSRWNALVLVFILVLAPLSGARAEQATHWEWSQEVHFVADHDPGRIVFKNVHETNVEVIYDGLTWEQVDAWTKGKPLLLAYSSKTGTVLVDPVTGHWVTVLDGLEQQPIDKLVDACLQKSNTTMDIQACYGDGYGRWDAQMNLSYQKFMDSSDPDIGSEAKQSLRVAQRAWLQYRDRQIDALSGLYGTRSGTIWPTVELQKRVALPKARALALATYLQAL
ncbi:MAG: lysozyme inhibitor LprI family protein [Rhodanobacter sp.]